MLLIITNHTNCHESETDAGALKHKLAALQIAKWVIM